MTKFKPGDKIKHQLSGSVATVLVVHEGGQEFDIRWDGTGTLDMIGAKADFGLVTEGQAPKVSIHTAGELHPIGELRITADFTFNLSRLLDDPAHKPGAELIEFDGTHEDVQAFVFESKGAIDLFWDMGSMIEKQLARGKSVTVLILCRGGKHRSVAFGECLAENFSVEATHHHKHLPRVVSGPARGQTWECRDQAGRVGEQVRIVTLTDDPDGETAVEFIVTRAAKDYEAELGSDGSMEATEFAQRYKLVS